MPPFPLHCSDKADMLNKQMVGIMEGLKLWGHKPDVDDRGMGERSKDKGDGEPDRHNPDAMTQLARTRRVTDFVSKTSIFLSVAHSLPVFISIFRHNHRMGG